VTAGTRLRALLGQEVVHAPGCYDTLSAMLVQQAGFDVAYLSGFALSAGLLGEPDLGLLGLDDIVGAVRRAVMQVKIPLVVDIDTGFGGPLNVRRTVLEVEAAGAAAVQIEDQRSPKRCGHFDNKEIVTESEAVARIELAVASRRSPDLVVIARTDAIAVEGVESAIRRALQFRDAGADMLFVEAIESVEQLREVADALGHFPLMYNAVEGGRSPMLDDATLAGAGVQLVIHPVTVLLETIAAQQRALAALHTGRGGTDQTVALAKDVVGALDAMKFHARHQRQ
jgi:2-methylisocitrate lyase-like PEP mutase family enzyme